MPKLRLLLHLAALLPLLAASDARAVGFGEMRSGSLLGQLLHAEIEIEEELADRVDSSCLALFRPAQAGSDLPWLDDARLSFRRESGKGKLYISSSRPLLDPVLKIGVQSTCGTGRVAREYTFLASPVAIAGQDATPLVGPPAMGTSAEPTVRAKKIERLGLAAHRTPALPRPPRGMRASAPADAESELRLQMAGDLPALRSTGEVGRSMWRLEYRMLAMRHEPADDQLALLEKLRQLELGAEELLLASQLLDVAPAPASPGSEPKAPATVPDPQTPALMPKAVPERSTQRSTKTDNAPFDWLLYAGLGAATLAALFIAMRRRSSATPARSALPMVPPTPKVDEPEFSRPHEGASALWLEPGFSSPPEIEPAEPAFGASPELKQAEPFPPAPERIDANPVMELAEIMLSFGRVAGAAQALQEYIEANPKEALLPWIRLLEIYRGNDMRAEFEVLAASLNQNFNVEILRWDDAAPGGKLELTPIDALDAKATTLELIPHIRDRIVALWGKPGCHEYVQALLRDNRNGQRSGFAWPVVQELLFLLDLMAARKAAAE